LDADASVNLADEITRELAYAMAVKEDQCAFVGDGTSTYGGIVGLTYSFQKLVQDGGGTWTTDADKAKLGSAVVAAGNAFSEVTMQNFIDVKNKIARYPGINPSWFIHDAAAAATMERLMYALGGNAAIDATNGVPQRFLGYPVVYVNAMPSTEANSQVFALFGDLSQSTLFCDRQGIEVATNTQSETNFLTRSAQVLGTERFDFIVHDNGNYNATAANRTRGAVAALISTNA
jgi:HK97 family phage major capsid protein